jgi:hypothetical protein
MIEAFCKLVFLGIKAFVIDFQGFRAFVMEFLGWRPS